MQDQLRYLNDGLQAGDIKAIARAISFVENEVEGYDSLLASLKFNKPAGIIGITGPPGAGKSTLVDALIRQFVEQGNRIAVLCVDPSSPFHLGALLGDRIRMSEWYNHPAVFIRSLATRGSLGGLNPKIIEITELLKATPFDYILIETVGVGQSEIDIAGLADTTVVVLVPEAGDEVQTMKAGLMEVADIFVVNKADRPNADTFINNLKAMLAPAFQQRKVIPIIKTIALQQEGIQELYKAIQDHSAHQEDERHALLLTERAYQLIQEHRMKDINKADIKSDISKSLKMGSFNLYQFIQNYTR